MNFYRKSMESEIVVYTLNYDNKPLKEIFKNILTRQNLKLLTCYYSGVATKGSLK